MLTITIPKQRLWDGKEFLYTKEYTITVEHSLVSISKWEAKWHIPFISDDKKTNAQHIDYVKCMTLTQNVDEEAYAMITTENLESISKYIEDTMTATWFSEPKSKPQGPVKKEIVTSELIYYWMIALEIPFECQKWHLNRLLTLIKVCNAKQKAANSKTGKGSKVNRREILASNAELNASRKKALGTSG